MRAGRTRLVLVLLLFGLESGMSFAKQSKRVVNWQTLKSRLNYSGGVTRNYDTRRLEGKRDKLGNFYYNIASVKRAI